MLFRHLSPCLSAEGPPLYYVVLYCAHCLNIIHISRTLYTLFAHFTHCLHIVHISRNHPPSCIQMTFCCRAVPRMWPAMAIFICNDWSLLQFKLDFSTVSQVYLQIKTKHAALIGKPHKTSLGLNVKFLMDLKCNLHRAPCITINPRMRTMQKQCSCAVHNAAGVTINSPSIMLMLPLSTDQQIEDSPVSVSLTHPAAKTGSRQKMAAH